MVFAFVPCGVKGCVELLAKGVSVLAGAPGIGFMGSCGCVAWFEVPGCLSSGSLGPSC